MWYPLKFKPVFKDYIWGGRTLSKLGKSLPEGSVAESWEISSHSDGVSVVAEGKFKGMLLTNMIEEYKAELMGSDIYNKNSRFPLLIKFIDANDRLSVQVHPNDEYALVEENGELGKNEMWYVIDAKPGAKLIYGIKPGIDKETFKRAVNNGILEECLNYVNVSKGDFLNIPAGLIHAIGEGILLAEIQQNSNTTYRVYDYDRLDKQGNKRPLHVEKALDVIDFNFEVKDNFKTGIKLNIGQNSYKNYRIANKYFSVEEYSINGKIEEKTDGSKFYIFIIIEGSGEISWSEGKLQIKRGDSILIPASLGGYCISGEIYTLKTYVPNLEEDVIKPLLAVGYSLADIKESLEGLNFLVDNK